MTEFEAVASALEAEFQRVQRRRMVVVWKDAAKAAVAAWYAHMFARAQGVATRLLHEVNIASGTVSPLRIEAAALILAQKAEIERLKLDLAAQECLQDSAYNAGMKAGWNFCVDDDHAGYQRIAGNTEHIAELRRIRGARQALGGPMAQDEVTWADRDARTRYYDRIEEGLSEAALLALDKAFARRAAQAREEGARLALEAAARVAEYPEKRTVNAWRAREAIAELICALSPADIVKGG